MKYFLIFVLFKVSQSCTPSISAPLIPVPDAQPINLISNPQLPPISFQLDNESPVVPHSDDYVEEPVSVQKDSVVPLQGEKLKNRFSLFDLFRPLSIPQNTQATPVNEKSVELVSMNISLSPPVHWTFCVPSCGVNDQAVDADDAFEKAHDDVLEAVQSSCTNSGVKCMLSSVEVQYYPESVLTEDFGAYFDLSGNRYKISGKTIPYRINSLNPGAVQSFKIPMKISFRLSSPITEKNAQALKQKVVDYLAARKSVHVTTEFF
uniref:SEA domain-containing protein n=1 Tax=Caenorhabditis japonica TaxID=281687 RepID=A0A8R1EUC9_CAEJA